LDGLLALQACGNVTVLPCISVGVQFGAFLDGYTGGSFTLLQTLGMWERDIALPGDTALWGVLVKEQMGYFLISSYQSGFALGKGAFHAQKSRCFS
jgi:hypothetical protein